MGAPREDLRLLSIFHYVLAGLTALLSLFPLIHVTLGIAMITGALDGGAHGGARATPPPALFGWLFVVMGSAFILAGLAFAAALVLAGRFLARQRHWTFCMVIAGFACTFVPFGTVLGVFTLVTLSKPEVKALFQAAAGAPAAAPPPNAWS